jgi:hypothetical protein
VVGQEQRDDLRARHGVADRAHLEAGVLGGRARAAAVAQADLHVDARVAQVQRMGVPLAAVADDGDGSGQEVEVAFAVDRCHLVLLFSGEDVLPGSLVARSGGAAEADAPGAD